MTAQVDTTYFGGTWPINITGNCVGSDKAKTVANNQTGTGLIFNFSDPGGSPPWIWGGSDGVNQRVYAATAVTVGTASNANALGGVGPTGYPRADSISFVGLANNDPMAPYMRRSSDSGIVLMVRQMDGTVAGLAANYPGFRLNLYNNAGTLVAFAQLYTATMLAAKEQRDLAIDKLFARVTALEKAI